MRRIRVLVPLLALLALVATACGSGSLQDVASDDGSTPTTVSEAPPAGDDAGPDEPTPDPTTTDPDDDPSSTTAPATTEQPATSDPETARLEQIARSAQDESFRGEMFMTMSMGAEGFEFDMGSPTAPLARISFDGDETGMNMDLGVLLGDLFSSLGAFGLGDDDLGFDPADFTMEMVMTDDAMYLHSPFLGVPGATGAESWMQAAADGWISISLDGLTSSEALADFGEISGLGSTAGVDQYFALLENVDGVEPLGPSQVRGNDVEGYRVTVSIEELMALQGASAEEMLGAEFVDLFEDFAYTFDVFIDADGRLHAIDIIMDDSLFESLGDELGDSMPGDFSFEMSMRLELFDHGSSEIDVVVPFGAVDVTDEFLAAASLDQLELGG
ncbi:MAG: hypothetical protein OES57_04790 [Acidimicrobiia bacterium]|nr:hypothetical protein [Acidimicrobiia bacterium]